MSGNAKSKSSKNKSKNNNGQLAQNANNGGPVINSQANQRSLGDMNYMSLGQGQGPGQAMPQGPSVYTPPYMTQYQYQSQNQAVSGNLQNMQNVGYANMQGQCQGQGGQQTQQSSVQYDLSGNYSGLQQNSKINNSNIDSSTIVTMIQQMNNTFTERLSSIELIVLGFNDTSTLEGHFVSSPREREKRDRRESRGDE